MTSCGVKIHRVLIIQNELHDNYLTYIEINMKQIKYTLYFENNSYNKINTSHTIMLNIHHFNSKKKSTHAWMSIKKLMLWMIIGKGVCSPETNRSYSKNCFYCKRIKVWLCSLFIWVTRGEPHFGLQGIFLSVMMIYGEKHNYYL